MSATRSKATVTEVLWRSHEPHARDEFYVLADAIELEKFKKDSSLPLIQVVDAFEVFVNIGGVKPNEPMRASEAQLKQNFGDATLETAIKKILLEGRTHGPSKGPHAHMDRESDIGKKMSPEKASGRAVIHQ